VVEQPGFWGGSKQSPSCGVYVSGFSFSL
jgi:hypothetical protein